MLAATTLVGGGVGNGGSRATVQAFLMLVTTSSYGDGLIIPRCYSSNPEGWSKLVPFLLRVFSPTSQQWHLHLSGEQHWSKRGQGQHPVWVRFMLGWTQHASQNSRHLPICCLCVPAMASLTPFRCSAVSNLALSPQAHTLLGNGNIHPNWELHQR